MFCLANENHFLPGQRKCALFFAVTALLVKSGDGITKNLQGFGLL